MQTILLKLDKTTVSDKIINIFLFKLTIYFSLKIILLKLNNIIVSDKILPFSI